MRKRISSKMLRAFCVAFFCGAGGTLLADDVYVSSKGLHDVGGVIWGTYTDDAGDHDAYTNLQEAVNVAAKDSTVWVDNDYVLDSGSTTQDKRVVRLSVTKVLTVRGKSGDWRTGPSIVGAYATGGSFSDPKSCCGDTAVSCVGGSGAANVKLIGFRLIRGATQAPTSASAPGYAGGAYGATLENCLVADCVAAWRGGGVNTCTTIDCVISNCHCRGTSGKGSGSEFGGGSDGGTHTRTQFWNCYSANNGGGIRGGTLYDCVLTNCTAGSFGGATQASTCYGTKIYGGTAKNGGGAGYQSTFYDGCLIYGCGSQAVVAGNAFGCRFERNSATAYCFKGNHVVSNCTFVANTSPAVGGTLATTGARIVDSVLTDNVGTSISVAMQNGGDLIVSNCTITCSGAATDVAVYSARYNGTGTKAQRFTIYDCVIAGPVRGNGDVYNTLITGFSGSGATVKCHLSESSYASPAIPLNLYNCTVTGNRSTDSAGGVLGDFVNAYNTIIRGNRGKQNVTDTLKTAVNCCLEDDAVATTATDCIRVEPELFTGTRGLYYPTKNSPCRSSGSLTAYTLMPTDLAGQPRTSAGGTTVAIGACEYDPNFVGAAIVCMPEVTKAPASGTFVVSSSGLGETGLTYYWDFEGDGTIDLVTNETTVAYSYPVEGDYTATVLVSNAMVGVAATCPMSIVDGYFVSAKKIHEVPGRIGGWGTYTGPDGTEHHAYTNLQQAIDAVPANEVIWIDKDFVCDEGIGGNNSRISIAKTLTLRGQTGDWRTGPTICGAYHASGTPCGANALRCVYANSLQIRLIGINLVGGATPATDKAAAGGAKDCTLEKCRVADCVAYYGGGGLASCTTLDCLVEDCRVTGASYTYGGGADGGSHQGTTFLNCSSSSFGGGLRGGTARECVFETCSANYGGAFQGSTVYDSLVTGCSAVNGGGAGYQATLYDGVVTNCSGIAVYASSAYGTLFVGNQNNTGGSAFGFKGGDVASNCTFRLNASPAVAVTEGLGNNKLMDCVFSNNVGACVSVQSSKHSSLRIERCTILCTNEASSAVYAGCYNSKSYAHITNRFEIVNSTISGRVSGPGEVYNTLIAGGTFKESPALSSTAAQSAYLPEGVVIPLTVVNCTVTDNRAKKGAAGAGGGYVEVYNSIVRGNVSDKGVADAFAVADHSCLETDATATTETGCVRCDPRFKGTVESPYVPKSPRLRGKATVETWMSDPADVRSRDLAGNPRLRDGKCDLGAYQMDKPFGLMLIVR